MAFDFVSLTCFLAVADTGSFTKAADRVGRTQSAVSQQIAKLESLLGKSLFIRGKTFALTTEGETFQGYARQIFKLHQEALDRFREPELAGEVYFGLPEDFASVFLSEVLVDFARLHPRVLLNVECDLTLNLFERFKGKAFDLVLVKMNRPEDFPKGLDIWSEELKWVGDGKILDFDSPIPLVLSPPPCVYRAQALKALESTGKKGRLVFSSPSFAGTTAAVKAGMGITVLPRTMIPESLEALETKELGNLNNIHVSLLKHQEDNAAINSFEQFVLKKCRKHMM